MKVSEKMNRFPYSETASKFGSVKKLAAFILEKRNWLFAIAAVFAAVNIYFMGLVQINTDMTVYLPEDSNVRAGLEILQEQFDDNGASLYVMFEGLGTSEIATVLDQLSELAGVDGVAYQSEGDFTLYSLELGESDGVLDAIHAQFAQYSIHLSGSLEGVDPVPDNMMLFIAIPTVIILTLILFAMCASWFEPVIFFINIGIAILINLGTNVIFEHVSDVTMMIAALLQVVLSMDYSIIFLNRYRMEKQAVGDSKKAMKATIQNSFSVISWIAFTTIVGMLMLAFMSFRIGADIGFVIAKGVAISLVCVFAAMPALILLFDSLIERTAKPVLKLNMAKVGTFSHKIRFGVLAVFLVLFGISIYLQQGILITYSETGADPVHHVFDLDNSFVILYENADEAALGSLVESLEQTLGVLEVTAYGNTLGQELTAEEISYALGMDAETIALILKNASGEPVRPIALGEFLGFLPEVVATNPLFAASMEPTQMDGLAGMVAMMEPAMLAAVMGPEELSELLGMEPVVITQLLYLHAITHDGMPEGTMTLPAFMAYLMDDFSQNPLFEPMFTPELLGQLADGVSEMEAGRQAFVGPDFSRAIIRTDLPIEGDVTTSFIESLQDGLNAALEGESFILGASAMPHEMSLSFPSEHSFITILTAVAFFFVTALSFKSLPVAVILVFVIQAAVYITMGIIYFEEGGIMYLPLIIAQVLLKSRVIDYGILLTANYVEARQAFGVKDAIINALDNSISTILTSGLIIVLVTFVTGLVFVNINASISAILLLIAQGCLIGTLISVFVLPSLIAIFDKWVTKAKASSH
ncbi:MAG: MMPL family transporter [Turicibacter sp.]|nr:MMPL family transporter [Turicibacter sp.]